MNITGKICDFESDNIHDCKAIELLFSDDYLLFGNHSNDVMIQAWGVAFTSVLFFYFSGLAIGSVLGFIKSRTR
ncbi:hypothetical protein A1D23_03000 [Chelonobacter oris]|uniref:hypothetical protein n=1 Tax=Chelonobacter oris TaxID=505317 RepID=UPI00244ADF0A|nr:hypothetical protein [Chelonobacter oris]MDH3001576.1 hypothetical protein [Chelonobacter oris]